MLCICGFLSACSHFPHFHMDVDLEEEKNTEELILEQIDERSSADKQNDHYRALLNKRKNASLKE